jgi:hypothetical protein
MHTISKLPLVLPYALVAVVASSLYAWQACSIFGVSAADKTRGWKVHQAWFNFAGAMLGWAALYYAAYKAYWCLNTGCPVQLSIGDAAAMLVAFIGVTGHLPYTAMGIMTKLNELGAKLTSSGA